MERQIKISVIIPIYNVEKYLRRCLDSVINQTLQELEIICINDGSKDNSLNIIKEYEILDDRIIVIDKINEGLSTTRNLGINIAKGEYIFFLDSDDWIDFNFLEKLYTSAIEYNADIAVGGIIRLHKIHKKVFLKFEKEILLEDFEQKLKYCDVPDKSYCWNKLYKLEELKKHNLYFEDGRIFEDIMFTPKALFNLKRLVIVPNTYYFYWRRRNSLVTLKSQKAIDDLVFAKNYANTFYKEHDIDVDKFSTTIKRYKFFGLSIFKTKTKLDKTTYYLFNILKWTV